MQARAVARNILVSPRKARLVVDQVRGKDVLEAEAILSYMPQKSARLIKKVLSSAVANAENNLELDRSNLYVYRAFIDEGPVLKRFRARAMGRASRIRKRTSHITVILKEKGE